MALKSTVLLFSVTATLCYNDFAVAANIVQLAPSISFLLMHVLPIFSVYRYLTRNLIPALKYVTEGAKNKPSHSRL